MPTAVHEPRVACDVLPAGEKDAAVSQLLLRRPAGAGDLPEAGYEALADELFLTYDAAEADDSDAAR